MSQETSNQPDISMVEVAREVEETREVEEIEQQIEVTEDPVGDHDYFEPSFEETISPKSTISPGTPFVSICLSHYIVQKLERK